MKITKSIKLVALIISSMVVFTSCNNDDLYNKEMYENLISLLSDDDHFYHVEHTLDEGGSDGYFTVSAGGSLDIDRDVTVTFDYDDSLLIRYNDTNFENDTLKMFKVLPADRYTISSMSTTIKASEKNNYAHLPVHVRTLGLSPDTVYVIPLQITGVSAYATDPEKVNAMYRVYTYNEYASQYPRKTMYTSTGELYTSLNAVGEPVLSKFSASKTAAPITNDQIRIFAGSISEINASGETIHRSTIIIKVNEDLNDSGMPTVSFFPYGSIEVEGIYDRPNANVYEDVVFGETIRRTFYLRYRYRLEGSETWTYVDLESLVRQEE